MHGAKAAISTCAVIVADLDLRALRKLVVIDPKAKLVWESVALPGPRSIHRIRTAKRACPPIVPLGWARPNYYR
jgi:hypothetical protein